MPHTATSSHRASAPGFYTGHLSQGEPRTAGPSPACAPRCTGPSPASLDPDDRQLPHQAPHGCHSHWSPPGRWPPVEAVAASSSCDSCNGGPVFGGRLKFVPSAQLSPQGNQDCNHNSKDRLVLLFSFFFLKGVRAWKIQHTNETKGQKKKKIQKKIENRKMYLQVVHYYDQKHRHLLL